MPNHDKDESIFEEWAILPEQFLHYVPGFHVFQQPFCIRFSVLFLFLIYIIVLHNNIRVY